MLRHELEKGPNGDRNRRVRKLRPHLLRMPERVLLGNLRPEMRAALRFQVRNEEFWKARSAMTE